MGLRARRAYVSGLDCGSCLAKCTDWEVSRSQSSRNVFESTVHQATRLNQQRVARFMRTTRFRDVGHNIVAPALKFPRSMIVREPVGCNSITPYVPYPVALSRVERVRRRGRREFYSSSNVFAHIATRQFSISNTVPRIHGYDANKPWLWCTGCSVLFG